MQKKRTILFSIVALFGLVVSGCLTTEYKEYTIKLNDDGSGEAAIKFINIVSQMDDSTDISKDDFNQLISDYIEGDALQNDFPDAKIISKKLFAENGYLCGEVNLTFDSLSSVNLFQFDKQSPYMSYVNSYSETYVESNGLYDENVMPVVFWNKNIKKLYLKTQITEVDEDTGFVSLIENYRNWEK
jgi:hypothetical protein